MDWTFTPDGLPQLNPDRFELRIPRPPHEQHAIRITTTTIRKEGLNPLTQHRLEQLVGKQFPPNPTRQDIELFCHNSE